MICSFRLLITCDGTNKRVIIISSVISCSVTHIHFSQQTRRTHTHTFRTLNTTQHNDDTQTIKAFSVSSVWQQNGKSPKTSREHHKNIITDSRFHPIQHHDINPQTCCGVCVTFTGQSVHLHDWYSRPSWWWISIGLQNCGQNEDTSIKERSVYSFYNPEMARHHPHKVYYF